MPPPDCPFCGNQNPPSAKFCNECGSPLHLAPCRDCGAVNNLAEAHCWRCGSVLRPLDAPPVDVEREPAAPVAPAQPQPGRGPLQRQQAELDLAVPLPNQEQIEEELVALEQEVQDLARAPATPNQPVPGAPREASVSHPPAPPPPLTQQVVAPHARPSRLMAATAMAGVVALGIAVGIFLYTLGQKPVASPSAAAPPAPLQAAGPAASGVVRDAGEPPAVPPAPAAGHEPNATVPPASPPPAPRMAAAAPEPRVVQEVREGAAAPTAPGPQASETPTPPSPPQVIFPKEPRVVREVQEAAAALSQPKALDPPIERRLASDGGEALRAPAGAADASCPPAVAAMALCEWVAGAKRQ